MLQSFVLYLIWKLKRTNLTQIVLAVINVHGTVLPSETGFALAGVVGEMVHTRCSVLAGIELFGTERDFLFTIFTCKVHCSV